MSKKITPPSFGEPDYLSEHPFNLVRYPLPNTILIEEARIPMRDGIFLAASVFRPTHQKPVPAVAAMTPYGKNNYDQWNLFRDPPIGSVPGGGFYLGTLTLSDHTPFEAPDPGFWVPQDYAVVIIDLAGRGKSESNPTHSPGLEARWQDIMRWLEQQPWCTGNVGISGVSALCVTQWIAAKNPAPPQLKAIIPWEGFNETGRGGGYGGIPEKAFVKWLMTQWMEPNFTPNTNGPEPYYTGWQFDMPSIEIPALVCASFSDQELHTCDTFGAFMRIGSPQKWLYNHRRQKWGVYYGKEALALQKRFFDCYLKNDANTMNDVPRIRLEINKNRFDYKVMHAKTWPIENTQYVPRYLDSDSATLKNTPVDPESSCLFSPTPKGDLNNRAIFDMTFDKDTDIIGHMTLKLWIEAINTDDVDLFIGIEKIDAKGNKVFFFSASGGNANGPVSRGWLRASLRALNPILSTEWRPVLSLKTKEPLIPNQITPVVIPIMPSGTTFLAGETLRLVVQSWSVPGEWEGGETREWDTISTGQCRLHTGGNYPSCLIIPIV